MVMSGGQHPHLMISSPPIPYSLFHLTSANLYQLMMYCVSAGIVFWFNFSNANLKPPSMPKRCHQPGCQGQRDSGAGSAGPDWKRGQGVAERSGSDNDTPPPSTERRSRPQPHHHQEPGEANFCSIFNVSMR